MMRTTFSLIILLLSISSYSETFDIFFEVENKNQSYEILNLEASIKAKTIIRDNAYLSFTKINKKNIENNKFSNCWLEFIKNKKVNIQVTENEFYLKKNLNNNFKYHIKFNPKKIKVLNVNQEDFLYFCKKRKDQNI